MNDTQVFSGSRFTVNRVQTSGKKGKLIERDVVIHPGAVIILPILDQEHLVMIRNERFAIGKELWELPAGTLEPKEAPLDTAKRELIEETGYEAKQMEFMLQFYTTPGFCNEIMHAYVARDLTFVGQHLEDSEKIIVEVVTWQKALEMARKGTIIDGKTLTTLLFYQAFNK